MGTVFEHQVGVRWRDVDGLGHVNHAVFLTYLEEGRDAFYVQALGRDPHYVVARVEIDLRAEVLYTDRQLQVRIEVERVGTTSLLLPLFAHETLAPWQSLRPRHRRVRPGSAPLAPAGATAAQASDRTVVNKQPIELDPWRRQVNTGDPAGEIMSRCPPGSTA